MDQYETDLSGLEPEAQQPQQTDSPSVPEPRKASPFADSPYEAYQPAAPAVEAPRQTYTQPVAPRKEKRRGNWLAVVAIVLVVCLTATFAVFMVANSNQNAALSSQILALQQQIKDLQEEVKKNSFTGNGNSISGTPSVIDGLTPGQVYARNLDSVVLIYARTNSGTSTGSGFVLTADGYVVTNYHVVEGGTSYSVITADGTEYFATLTGGDETNDVAVLKADITGIGEMPPVKLGSSDNLIVGDQVVAIGNPLGDLTSTLTVGYISAKDRDVSTDGTMINMLQTDAAINSGNSGGPLFNMKGEVIGITTAKYSGATSSGASIEGIGFAIPIDDVTDLINELIENGYVSRPYMGVYIRDMAEAIGVYVDSVELGGPAATAGVRRGDIIVQLGDYGVTNTSELSKALYNFDVGDTTTVTVYRNRQLLELAITFTEKPQTTAETVTPDSGTSDEPYSDWFDRFFGNGG